MRFLIDECLSPALVHLARSLGHEAYHLAHLGRAGAEDWEIVDFAITRDMILVTNNANDFRRLYGAEKLHPGFVILVPNVEREQQLDLFRAAIARLSVTGEPVNHALEVRSTGNDIIFDEYDWPRKS